MRVAVIGAGVIGASAAKALKDRGMAVTLFDPAPMMQARSSGDWMLYRIAHRSPDLVQAACDSLLIFEDWQGESGQAMIRRNGTVITGRDWALKQWADAMEEGHAAYEYRETSSDLHLPVKNVQLPSLIDPAGGVILVDRVRRFLEKELHESFYETPVLNVYEESEHAVIITPEGKLEFDAAIIAAGQNSPDLLKDTSIDLPNRLSHHFRFTFPLRRDSIVYPSWLSRIDHFIAYQHMAATGEWTIGLHMPDTQTDLQQNRVVAEKGARQLLQQYVRDTLPDVSPEVLSVMYGTVHSDITDGYEIIRHGALTTTYGDNLFKLAPHIGVQLAGTVLGERQPRSLILPNLR